MEKMHSFPDKKTDRHILCAYVRVCLCVLFTYTNARPQNRQTQFTRIQMVLADG